MELSCKGRKKKRKNVDSSIEILEESSVEILEESSVEILEESSVERKPRGNKKDSSIEEIKQKKTSKRKRRGHHQLNSKSSSSDSDENLPSTSFLTKSTEPQKSHETDEVMEIQVDILYGVRELES